MTLAEQIKTLRVQQGMSQEKLAECMGVSRQAVTKWESGQSAPSTEKLFQLAELLGTSLDGLMGRSQVPAGPQIQGREERFARWRKNGTMALVVLGGYLLLYLLGRLLGGRLTGYSILGWLFTTDPQALSYLYGWLVHNHFFWYAAALSILPALFGKFRFSFVTLGGFALGLLLGEWLGPVRNPAPFQPDHYGWAIWGGVFLLSVVVGIVLELKKKKAIRAEKSSAQE